MGDGQALGSSEARYSAGGLKEPARECLTCGRSTREGKPYCIRHLGRLPYVRRLMDEVDRRSPEEQRAVPVDSPEARELEGEGKRRSVVPVEMQVGEDRFWVGLVPARGVERDPPPTSPTGPRRLRSQFFVRLRPFTKLLDRAQSKLVLLYLQERRYEMIPAGWLIDATLPDDRKLLEEARRAFSNRAGVS